MRPRDGCPLRPPARHPRKPMEHGPRAGVADLRGALEHHLAAHRLGAPDEIPEAFLELGQTLRPEDGRRAGLRPAKDMVLIVIACRQDNRISHATSPGKPPPPPAP